MQQFRTVVTPAKASFHITHQDVIMSIGSCFSENIGKKFSENKFNICINPFGQQYNPLSISNAIRRLISENPYTKDDLVFHNELYHSFDHHGSFSGSSSDEVLKLMNNKLSIASKYLSEANHLFLTFGTSHAFRLKSNDKIVSNCHKFPRDHFHEILLSPDQIVNEIKDALEQLWNLNKKINVILTISPVRYFAFGQYENSVSKAHLFTAIHQLKNIFPQLHYFPTYELVMDDLRDYRFYAEDMLHPNSQAIDYVWDSLVQNLIDKDSQSLMKEIQQINLAVKHRAVNPESEAHQKFLKQHLELCRTIENKYRLNMKDELETLSRELK